jgi:hypothetical protein
MWSDNPTLQVNAFLDFFRNYFHLANQLVHVTVPGKTPFSDTLLSLRSAPAISDPQNSATAGTLFCREPEAGRPE